MGSRSLDAGRRLLEVEERPTARGAGNVVRLENPDTGRLEDIVGESQGLTRGLLGSQEHRITNPVAEQGSQHDCGGE